MTRSIRQIERVAHVRGIAVHQISGARYEDQDDVRQIMDELVKLSNNADLFIVLDFGRVEFLSSEVFGRLIALSQRCKQCGGLLVMCDVCESLIEAFKIMRLNKIVPIELTREDAIERCSQVAA